MKRFIRRVTSNVLALAIILSNPVNAQDEKCADFFTLFFDGVGNYIRSNPGTRTPLTLFRYLNQTDPAAVVAIDRPSGSQRVSTVGTRRINAENIETIFTHQEERGLYWETVIEPTCHSFHFLFRVWPTECDLY